MMYTRETIGCAQGRLYDVHKGDYRMYTRETIRCTQGRLYDVHKGDYRMYTREAIGCTQGRQKDIPHLFRASMLVGGGSVINGCYPV